MPRRVTLSDGRTVTVQSDDPQQAAAAALAFQRANPIQPQAPQPTPAQQRQNRARMTEQQFRALPRAQQDRIASDAVLRQQQTRNPIGAVAQPLIDLVTDPARRAEAGRSIRGAADWIGQQFQTPLDFPRLGQETMDSARQAWDDLPDTAAHIFQNLPEIGRGVSYGPLEDEQRAQMSLDVARAGGNQPGVTESARRANEATAQNSVNAVGPLLGAGGGILRTAGTAAAIDAPFALARQEGSLQERLPGALTEMGGVGLLSGALRAGANAVPGATRLPPQQANIADAFERANVPPFLAAVAGAERAPLTMAIAENPLGGNVRRNLERSATATADEAQSLAGQFGAPVTRETAGEAVQAGVRRFANERDPSAPQTLSGAYRTPSQQMGFATKADILYDHTLGRIQAAEDAALTGAGGAPRLGTAPVTTTVNNTRRVLAEIVGAVRNQSFRAEILDPQIARFAQLMNGSEPIRFGDLRAFRTYVRNLQGKPMLRQGVDDAGLARIESALTDDIAASAENIGGLQAAHVLRRVDNFYRLGQQRIARALKPFADQKNPAAAYDRVIQLASDSRGSANVTDILSLKRSLRPDEFRTVQATLASRLGRVKKGAANVMEDDAFSLENFVTNYAEMSPQARRVLFGSRGGGNTDTLADALDNLAYVAGRQKAVRGFTNFSRSGSSVQNVATYAAAISAAGRAFLGDFLPALEIAGVAVGGRLMGEALTNPRFVRWLVSASRTARSGGSWVAALPQLAALAARDPVLGEVYNQLRKQAERPDAQAMSPAASPQDQPAFPPAPAQRRQATPQLTQ